MTDVLVVAPFRKPTFRHAISPWYPGEEPWDSPPFTAAGEIEAAGLEAGVLMLQNLFPAYDERNDREELRDLLDAHRARAVLFVSDPFVASRSTATLYGMRIVAELVRPGTVLGACGRLATTAWPTLFAQLPALDFAVVGEADATIGPAMRAILSHRPPASAPLDLPGVVFRERPPHPGALVPARVDSLDERALPAYHLAEPSLDVYVERMAPGRPAPSIPFSLRTSLGCRFKCKFCAGVPHWREYRRKSARRVEAEIEALERIPGGRARLAFLEDEVFTADPDHVREIVPVLASHAVVLEGLYTHSSMISEQVVELLRPVARKVFLGMDSADDEVLREMGKGQRFDSVLAAVKTAAAGGLPVHLEWIVGAPGETVDSTAKSLIAIFNLLSTGAVESVNTYVYCPHPGTEYAENGSAYDLAVLGDLESMQESGGYPAAATKHLSREQVFVAYLLSQLVIQETVQARAAAGPVAAVRAGNRAALAALLEGVGSPDAARVLG